MLRLLLVHFLCLLLYYNNCFVILFYKQLADDEREQKQWVLSVVHVYCSRTELVVHYSTVLYVHSVLRFASPIITNANDYISPQYSAKYVLLLKLGHDLSEGTDLLDVEEIHGHRHFASTGFDQMHKH